MTLNFPIDEIRSDFEVLKNKINGNPIVYFDSGATALKPKQVIDEVDRYYRHETASVHRGVHTLSEKATEKFENARIKLQKFINASSEKEIIFTSGTTGSINLVAQSYGRNFLKDGDEVLISELEHHANIVPWQLLQQDKKIVIKVIPITKGGVIDLEAYKKLLSPKTKLVAFTHVSNVLGTIQPAKEIISLAHSVGAVTVVDGAQAAPHIEIDVTELDADFYALSGHKLISVTGTGILFGKKKWLDKMPPSIGGGAMIEMVTFDKTTFKKAPEKFEAGTPHIAGAIGMAAAIDYIEKIGFEKINKYEDHLNAYFLEKFANLPGIKISGHPENRVPVFSLVLEDVHPHDIGTLLDQDGIAVRTGHHCCQPLMRWLKVPATTRASLAFYNTTEEIDKLAKSLQRIQEIFK